MRSKPYKSKIRNLENKASRILQREYVNVMPRVNDKI